MRIVLSRRCVRFCFLLGWRTRPTFSLARASLMSLATRPGDVPRINVLPQWGALAIGNTQEFPMFSHNFALARPATATNTGGALLPQAWQATDKAASAGHMLRRATDKDSSECARPMVV